jgi:apolipoprotein N-acyltransferase
VNSIFIINNSNKNLVALAFASAVILGLSFPPFPVGILACIGFVPFFLLVEKIDSLTRFFRYSYCLFFLFTLITLYWVGGFTHLRDPYLMIAGVALFFWQPLFFTIPATIYFWFKKNTQSQYSVFFFPFIWVTFEWLYALGEFAFPWLSIGNTQTYNLEKIQYADITGVYGISFWVLLINGLVFLLVKNIQWNGSKKIKYSLFALILVLYVLPNVYSWIAKKSIAILDETRTVTIGIVQPNIDPWIKWDGLNTISGRWHQIQSLLKLTGENINKNTDIVVLPESAILLNLPAFKSEVEKTKNIIDSFNVVFVSGYAKVKYYESDQAPISSNVIKGTNVRYDSYNSILMMEPGSNFIQNYSKMRLVPFAERIPYADDVSFLIEPLRWGVGISNWGKGTDSILFYSRKLQTHFLSMVCYESVFPEFVASFVNKGAEFLVFITNDSWWGNTSGARQHNQFAVLRAVENRRWVIRCANGGISSFIDPYGTMYDKTKMYEKAYIQRAISPFSKKTFYTEHGDIFARICAIITLLTFFISISYRIFGRKL